MEESIEKWDRKSCWVTSLANSATLNTVSVGKEAQTEGVGQLSRNQSEVKDRSGWRATHC